MNTTILLLLWHRTERAICTPVPPVAWSIVAALFVLSAVYGIPAGIRTGFLALSTPRAPLRKLAQTVLMAFFVPGVTEEMLFRAWLLPHPLEAQAGWRVLGWATVSLVAFVVYHPLKTPFLAPAKRNLFVHPLFLCTATGIGAV